MASDNQENLIDLLNKIQDPSLSSTTNKLLCETQSSEGKENYCEKLKIQGLLANPWPKRNLKVCWKIQTDQNELNHQFKYIEPEVFVKRIKKIIIEEFKPSRTGIEFTGWLKCIGEEEADVILYVGENEYDGAYLKNGPGFIGAAGGVGFPREGGTQISYNGSNGKSWTSKLTVEEYLAIVVIHEFAHVVGLHHQKDRFSEWSMGLISDETQRATKYDKSSLMSYKTFNHLVNNGLHFPQNKPIRIVEENGRNTEIKAYNEENEVVEFKPSLSDGDIKALRCLYP